MVNNFVIRLAESRDIWDIYNLASSPEVRAVSLHNGSITKLEHKRWYAHKLRDPHTYLYVIENKANQFMGTIRFDQEKADQYVVTIYLATEFRGKGLGTPIIRQASSNLISSHAGCHIKAVVLADNLASQKSFLKAGYKEVGTLVHEGKSFLELRYN